MKLQHILLCAGLSVCMISPSFAQKFEVKQSDKVVDDFSRSFYGIDADNYLAVHYASPMHGMMRRRDNLLGLEIYDKNLKNISTKSIPGFEELTYKTGMVVNNRLYAFFRDEKSGNVSRYEIDPNKGSVVSKDNLFSAPTEKFKLYEGVSLDSSFRYFMTSGKTDKESSIEFHGVVMDRDMKIVTKFNFYTDDDPKDFKVATAVVSNDGILYVIRGVQGSTKKADYSPAVYHLSQVSKDGKHTQTALNFFPQGLVTNVSWFTKGKELQFSATMSPYSTKGFTKLITGFYDPETKKSHDVKETDLTAVSPGSEAADLTVKFFKDKGISEEARLIKTYPLSGGGATIILEINAWMLGSTMSQPAPMSNGGFSGGIVSAGGSHNIARSMYVYQIDGQGKLQWIRLVSKNQEEMDHSFYISMASMMDKNENLYLFFQDNAKNEKVDEGIATKVAIPTMYNVGLAIATVKNNGTVTKQFMQDKETGKVFFKFSPYHYEQVSQNEIIYDFFEPRAKMGYQLGKIVIK